MKVQPSDTAAPPSGGDPLGLPAALAPFGAADDAPWAVDLPEDPDAAGAMLDAMELRMAVVERALDSVPERIDAAADQARRPARTAFALGGAADADGALAAALRPQRRVSFGLGGGSAETTSLQARLEALVDAARHVARIETRIEGRVVASTSVGWGGDARMILAPDVAPETVATHGRTLAIAVRVRQSRLRFVMSILSGATRVALQVAGGGATALPAIYTFVKQVIDELDALNAAAAVAAPDSGDPR